MKKTFLSMILSSALLLILCFGVFASPSPETTGFTAEFKSATDAAGNPITVELKAVDAATAAEAAKIETIKQAMGDKYREGMITVDIRDVTVPAGTAFPVTLTFAVKGVTADMTGCFLHFNGSDWEMVEAIFGTDTMTGTFSSLSPVAFVMLADVTQNQVGTSPQTSDTITAVLSVLVLSAAVLILSKKRINSRS